MPRPLLEARLPNVHRAFHNDSVIFFFFWQATISYLVFFLPMKMFLSNNGCQTNDTLKSQTTRHSKRINSVRKQISPGTLRAKLKATVLLIIFVNVLELGGPEGGGHMGIFLSERAFPQVRVSARRLAAVLRSVSTLAGTHGHAWFSHHLTRRTGLDPHGLWERKAEWPSEASIFFGFGLTLHTKAELRANDRVD